MAVPYSPPSWASGGIFKEPPKHGRLPLANLPTPLYRLNAKLWGDRSSQELLPVVDAPHPPQFWIKRDDSTGGVELGGNKIRKLEFLLADALAQGCDSVITIGGEQSNHCRATAAAARMLGLEPHLILRTPKALPLRTTTTTTTTTNPNTDADIDDDDKNNNNNKENNNNDIGFVGNVLMDRMVGSQIYTCSPGEYGRLGSEALVARLAKHLQSLGKKPYPIPVGGSNGLGSWGYMNAVDEVLQQWQSLSASSSSVSSPVSMTLDHVVFACGSGGTAAGIVLGFALAHAKSQTPPPTIHAIGVCDDPDYFYHYVAKIATEMGLSLPLLSSSSTTQPEHDDERNEETVEEFIRRHMLVHQGKGLGYAVSTEQELEFVRNFAQATGIVLDPVYSGKALYHFARYVVPAHPQDFAGKNVLFLHTGGALGLFDKVDTLSSSTNVGAASPCQRLDVYGNGIGLALPAVEGEDG
ncbi:hypothetical protein ACA910_005612 [Epithemia clementina (nom. ined.)]